MTPWTYEQASAAAAQPSAALPVMDPRALVAVDPARDVWDMWQIAHADGRTATVDGCEWWFFLAAPRLPDPEGRHDLAEVRLYSRGPEGWRDHGPAFPDGFTPGSRDWSGSAVLAEDGATLTMHFTAAGRRGDPRTFEQRLFETIGRFEGGRLSGWSEPVETAVADGATYALARQREPVDDRIKGFRDPGYFRDPATGVEHLLFTASAGWVDDVHDGVIGLACRDTSFGGDRWRMVSPLVHAVGVNSELERPHIVAHDRRLYLFWSTQGKRFAPGIGAPTGLYGMVADRIDGRWRPLNGTGLVAANPAAEPRQAYCWWVTGELEVISFADYPASRGADLDDPAVRRRHFGGTAAPAFRLSLSGDRAGVVGAASAEAA